MGYRKVHAITSPTVTHKSIRRHHKKAVSRRRHEQAKLLPTSPPFQLGGQRYLWDRRVYHRRAARAGRRACRPREGCVGVTVGQGDGSHLGTKVLNNCSGEEMEVKLFLVTQPPSFLTGKHCSRWDLLSKLLLGSTLSCRAGRGVKTAATYREHSQVPPRSLSPAPEAAENGEGVGQVSWLEASLGTRKYCAPEGILLLPSQAGAPPFMHTSHTHSHPSQVQQPH